MVKIWTSKTSLPSSSTSTIFIETLPFPYLYFWNPLSLNYAFPSHQNMVIKEKFFSFNISIIQWKVQKYIYYFFFYIKENGRSLNLRPCNFYFNFGCVLGYIWPHVSLSLIIDSDKHEWADKSKYYLYIWFFLVLKILSTWLIQQSAYKTKNSPFKK